MGVRDLIERARELALSTKSTSELLFQLADALENARLAAIREAIDAIKCEECDGEGAVRISDVESRFCEACDGTGVIAEGALVTLYELADWDEEDL